MRHNRNKMGMVILMATLVMIFLLSGCVPAGNGTNGNGRTPDFLEVGGSYWAYTASPAMDIIAFVVVEIRNDGWILADLNGSRVWLNTAQIAVIHE